jgi:hypothetical protein
MTYVRELIECEKYLLEGPLPHPPGVLDLAQFRAAKRILAGMKPSHLQVAEKRLTCGCRAVV